MRFRTLAAMGMVVLGTTAAASPARADYELDRLRDEYRQQRRVIDDNYHDSLIRLNDRYARRLSDLNEDLRIARLTTHGAQRAYVEQVFAQRRQTLRNEFERRRDTTQRRWENQREQLRREFEIAREQYESRYRIGNSPFVVVPYGPGGRGVIYDGHGHAVRQVPPALGYLNLVLNLLD